MTDANPQVDFFGRKIYLNEFYYVYFAEQMAELDKARYRKYLDIMQLPGELKYRALSALKPEENPTIIHIKGRMLIEWSERGFLPQFDKDFETTRKLVFCPVAGMEFWLERSFMLRK